MIDFEAIEQRLKDDIDEYCLSYNDGHRSHLGASIIGHECPRRLWYIFRWVKAEIFSGRLLRLFNRGHREEARFLEWLRGIGCEVSDATADGKQHRVSAVMGHFGGSEDGQGYLPKRYDFPEKVLFEFKTNGTGSGFTAVAKQPLVLAKPQHWAQKCTYGVLDKIKYYAYFIINKNDDDLTPKVGELDHAYGNQLVAKAHAIIVAREPPPRISKTKSLQTCKFCHLSGVCFDDEPYEKNCRSCKSAVPVENAQWFCETHNGIIPDEFIKEGCGNYVEVK